MKFAKTLTFVVLVIFLCAPFVSCKSSVKVIKSPKKNEETGHVEANLADENNKAPENETDENFNAEEVPHVGSSENSEEASENAGQGNTVVQSAGESEETDFDLNAFMEKKQQEEEMSAAEIENEEDVTAVEEEKPEEKNKKETAEEKKARKAKEKKEKEEAKAKEKAEKERKKKEEKERKAAEKEKARLEKQIRKDNYTGWVYIPKTNFETQNGDIKLVMKGSTGSFGIYAIPESGSPRPLLATYDDFSSTYFALMIGEKEYRLNRESGVTTEARKTDYGAQIAYTIDKKAQCVVDFSFMPSIATSTRIDMLRVTVYTINLGKSTQSFTVKGVFDTSLGENTPSHFSTAARSKINSEIQFNDMSNEKWIRSSNEKAAIQFILNGRGITNPKCITLANKDLLSTSKWIPDAKEQRSFSSVLAYNNSAMAVNWKTTYLDPLKTDVITFYISVATDDNEPAGRDFLASLSAGKTALPSNLPDVVKPISVAPEPEKMEEEETVSKYYENMPVISGESLLPSSLDDDNLFIPETSPASTPVVPSGDKAVSVPLRKVEAPVEMNPEVKEPVVIPKIEQPVIQNYQPAPVKQNEVNNKPAAVEKKPEIQVSKYQLDPEYINRLLKRISELESDPALVDKAEVKRLNDELDAILEVLRSME